MLTLYNTLTRQKEVFTPLDSNHIRFYVCGPTVYDFAHLGNARPVVVFDVLYRLLQKLYPKVTYVRNITDVDDKINTRAKEAGESIDTITLKTTKAYHEDMKALNTLSPTVEPRATGHISHMLTMIKELIDKGFAYVAEGHVLFDVEAYKAYGRLSNRSLKDLMAGARIEIAPYKKNPHDFVLWKPSAEDLPGWDSPYGRGRPGWHIECSAMSKAYLGDTFDIHGGGVDLVFPHHENEIAQSCCANGADKMASIWMHNGHLLVEGEKMSKSLGNFLTVRDLIKKYPGEVLRLVFLQTHYRQPMDFKEDLCVAAKNFLDRLYRIYEEIGTTEFDEVESDIIYALQDDLNTPKVLSILAEKMNTYFSTKDKVFGEKVIASSKFLGFLSVEASTWFKGSFDGVSEEEIEKKILTRNEARKNKDYKTSDEIRKYLLDFSIILEDKGETTSWRRK